MYRKLSDRLIEEIVNYKKKHPLVISEDIGKKYNLSKSTVRRVFDIGVGLEYWTQPERHKITYKPSIKKLYDNFIKDIITCKKKHIYSTKKQLAKKFHVGSASIGRAFKTGVELGYWTEAERKDILSKSRVKKLFPPLIKEIVCLKKKYPHTTIAILAKKYDLGTYTIGKVFDRGIKLGYWTEAERKKLAKVPLSDSFQVLIKKHGEKKAKEIMANKVLERVKSDSNFYSKIGRKGGLATQKEHKHVLNNLKKGYLYGNFPPYYYGGIIYPSKGERLVAALAEKYGLINKIKLGINYQVHLNSRVKADFIFENKKTNKKIAVEYHRCDHPGDFHNDKFFKNYKQKRQELLRKFGYNSIIIEDQKEIYDNLLVPFGVQSTKINYFKIKRKIADSLEEIDKKNNIKNKGMRQGSFQKKKLEKNRGSLNKKESLEMLTLMR